MRFVKSLVPAGLGLVAALVAPTGCVDNESSFFVQHALLIEEGGDCIFESDLPAYSAGVLDLSVQGPAYASYGIGVSVANQLASLGDPNLLRTETSYIRLEGAEISIEGLNGAPSVSAFTVPLSDTIPPSEGEDPGESIAYFTLVPRGAIQETGTYLITMRLFGHTLGGTPIEAGEFVWPLDVCEGCLATCEQLAPPCPFQLGGDYRHNCGLYANPPARCNACGDDEP
jgi:hypothetical protein